MKGLERVTRIFILLGVAVVFLLAGCSSEERQTLQVEGGDPYAGAQAIQRHGCHACHRIPGIAGAHSYVGPPLNNWSQRHYIAGNLQNTPENLIAWIMDPQAFEPGTAMPDMNINEQDARDIAAYLYTLDDGDEGFGSEGE